MKTLEERFDLAEEMIQKPSFRENKGLGNEVGYYIFDYPQYNNLEFKYRLFIKRDILCVYYCILF